MAFCMQCGHHHGDEGACRYRDSEGPCFCLARVPCDHVQRSRSVRNMQLVNVCACGDFVSKVIHATRDFSRGVDSL